MIYKLKPWILSWTCTHCACTNPESYNYCNGCGRPKP